MPHRSHILNPASLIVLFTLIFLTSVSLMAATDNPQNQPPAKVQTAEGVILPTSNHPGQNTELTGNYVGNETCLTCHEEQGKGLSKTLHGNSAVTGSPASKGNQKCETCHGPGKAHVESGDKKDIRSFKSLPAKAANTTCLSCHENRSTHVNWAGSKHDSRNVACVTCHSVHNAKSDKFQLKTVRESETCFTCHQDKEHKFKKLNHMPLPEDKMECSTCHDPHGSKNERQLRVGNTINESCLSCHTEKRGPFLNEHAPVSNNCVSCHDPHGSTNDRLLTKKVPFLCQQCHVPSRHPATVYDGAAITAVNARLIGRACVNCHNPHGSNDPAGFYFQR